MPPSKNETRGTRVALAGLVFGAALTLGPLALLPEAAAKPAHRASLADYYGKFLGANLNNCGACHVAPAPGRPPEKLADFPHNPFGDRLRRLHNELEARDSRADLPARLRAAAKEDSDGDGVPNEVELLTGHRPGDPQDRPARVELAALPRRQKQFQAFLSAYRWRPFEPVRRPAVPGVADEWTSGRMDERKRPNRVASSTRPLVHSSTRPLSPRDWDRNPIDAFIAAEQVRRGLQPRPVAPKAVLLRRVTLDLTGLSPTPAELHAFLTDTSPNAYEKVVERLLASPQYGERWGRHWMDVWRYSDWTGWGEQVRDSKPHIWRWRDWIVRSLNEDRGYDQMLREMLAGDELAPEDPETLAATGFLVRNFKLLSREKWMEDVVDHTGQAFLGLTVGCARCHDHMYDPISQEEYYRLRAVFEPHNVRTDWVPGQLDTSKDGLPRAVDEKPDAPTFFYVRGDERQPLKDRPLAPGVPTSLGGRLRVEPVSMPHLARFPEKQPHVLAALRADADRKVEAARQAAAAAKEPPTAAAAERNLRVAESARDALHSVLAVEALEDASKKGSPEWQAAATETVRRQRVHAAAQAVVARAAAADVVAKAEASMPPKPDDVKNAKEKLAAADQALAKAEEALKAPPSTDYKPRVTSNYPEASTGRRLAFARWLTSPDNPLTARVAVNQIWMRHFGEAIVPSVENFGRAGRAPSHPELLDWLAAELMNGRVDEWTSGRSGPVSAAPTSSTRPLVHSSTHSAPGWRMKRLHRLIVTSSTYRMASTPDAANLATDPDNRYLWRMNSRRLDAELVRDNVLHVAGRLDATMDGPEIDQNQGLKINRRSIYFRHAPEKLMEFLQIFDGPNPSECYFRRHSVMPQQALALANSEIALVNARLLARELDAAVARQEAKGAVAQGSKAAGERGSRGAAERGGIDRSQSAAPAGRGSKPSTLNYEPSTGFVTAAFERVLARAPTRAELAQCTAFLDEQTRRFADPGRPKEATAADATDGSKPAAVAPLRARENLILVLFNHNDFVTVR